MLIVLKAKWAIPMPRHPLQLHRSLANSETASKSEDTVLMLPEMDLADEWELCVHLAFWQAEPLLMVCLQSTAAKLNVHRRFRS